MSRRFRPTASRTGGDREPGPDPPPPHDSQNEEPEEEALRDFPLADRAGLAAFWNRTLLEPFRSFFRTEAASGVLLVSATLIALVWANSRYADAYFRLWAISIAVGPEAMIISKPLLLWINDGLMAIFFFVVGLEIKREVLIGELSSLRTAALPVSAAMGGMIVPAAIYSVLNAGTVGADGWGVPMATDIAFALGVVALLGDRIPLSLKIFLTAVAVADDLGAVLVIAFFYRSALSAGGLAVGALTLAILITANRAGIRRPSVYAVLGVVLWVALLQSGVHTTLAGVLLALVIPASWGVQPREVQKRAWAQLRRLDTVRPEIQTSPTASREALHALEKTVRRADVPLARFETGLHPWVAYGIMPLFALANAGVQLRPEAVFPLHPVTVGVLLGLFLGKQTGVMLFAWFATRLGIAQLPSGVRWGQIYGVSLLTGIGFTMSLFISGLAFGAGELLDHAKVGILVASLLSGVAGWAVLARIRPNDAGVSGGPG